MASIKLNAVPKNYDLVRLASKHWLLIFLVVFGIFNLLPIIAPIMMQAGWQWGGTVIYTMYSFLCHQMAQRSFFLFGPDVMLDANQLPLKLTGNQATDAQLLRQFRGNGEIGWKVAWSDRMVYMYGGVWLAALFYGIRTHFHKVRPISISLFFLLLLPMLIDGTTHFISDLDGLTTGFRYTNEWLAHLTGRSLPQDFYQGDKLGSFNSWIRLLSGITFGIAVIWLTFPYLRRDWLGKSS
jgi:uncharacterized membrane protein